MSQIASQFAFVLSGTGTILFWTRTLPQKPPSQTITSDNMKNTALIKQKRRLVLENCLHSELGQLVGFGSWLLIAAG